MPNPDFVIRVGDTTSIIQDTLEDENGDPVNISGATIRFHMKTLSGSGTGILDALATNAQVSDGSDGSKGRVSYTWAAGNTGLAGWYLAEWQVTYVGGAIQTFPNSSYVTIYMSEQVA